MRFSVGPIDPSVPAWFVATIGVLFVAAFVVSVLAIFLHSRRGGR